MSITEFCLEQSKVTDMKIDDIASLDDNTHGGGEIPPRTGLPPPIPSTKFKSQFWRRTHKQGCLPELCLSQTTVGMSLEQDTEGN